MVPEPVFLLLHEQPSDVKRVEQSQDERPLIHPPGTPSLRHAILAQVDFVVIGKIAHRMPDVEHQHVREHEQSIENVQRPLMCRQISLVALEHFDDPEDVPAGDDGAADVHEVQDPSQFLALLVGFGAGFGSDQALPNAATVEETLERNKEEEGNQLQYDRSLKHCFAGTDVRG